MQYHQLKPNINVTSLQLKGIYQSIKAQIFTTYNGKPRRLIFENVAYSQKEMNLIQQFRKLIQPIVNGCYYDDATMLRYIYSGDFILQNSLQKFKVYHQWMTNKQIQAINQSALKILQYGHIYTFGKDLKHRPIVIMDCLKLNFNDYKLQDYYSAINAVLNLVIKDLFIKGVIEKYLFIIDTGGKGFSLPTSGIISIVQKLSCVYSFRLGQMIALNTNSLIQYSYWISKHFINEETRSRITLLGSQNMNQLHQIVSRNQLQEKYGGYNANLIYHWPPRAPQIPKKIIQQQNFDQTQSSYFSIISKNEIFANQISQYDERCCVLTNDSCLIY